MWVVEWFVAHFGADLVVEDVDFELCVWFGCCAWQLCLGDVGIDGVVVVVGCDGVSVVSDGGVEVEVEVEVEGEV